MKRRLLFIFLSFYLCINLFAQNVEPHVEFIKSYGGSGFDGYAGNVGFHFTLDGNLLLATYGGSSDYDLACNPYDSYRGWLLKTDKLGNKIFSICYGGYNGYGEAFEDMQITKDSGCIVLCATHSIDSPAGVFPYACYDSINGYRNQSLVKYDKNGQVLWNHCYGPADYIRNVETTSDGGYIFLAAIRYAVGDVPKHWGDPFHANGWLVKVDSIGNIQWSEVIGGTGGEHPWRVKEISPGRYMTSITTGSIDSMLLNVPHYSTNDAWICTFDSVGNLLTSATVPWYGDWVALEDFTTTANGNIIGTGCVAGISNTLNACNTANLIQNAQVSENFATFSLNMSGGNLGINWCHTETEGGIGSVGYFRSLTNIGDSIFLLSGTENPAYDSLVCSIDNTYLGWLIAMRSDGQILWRKTLCGSQGSALNNSLLDNASGAIYISGVGESTDGDLTGVSNYGASDVWLIKFDFWPSGIDEVNIVNNISIYPNPTSSILNIDVSANTGIPHAHLFITNTLGEIVKSKEIERGVSEVDLSNLSPGMYIASILTSNKEKYYKKFIKE